jgi:hypothetical protein
MGDLKFEKWNKGVCSEFGSIYCLNCLAVFTVLIVFIYLFIYFFYFAQGILKMKG